MVPEPDLDRRLAELAAAAGRAAVLDSAAEVRSRADRRRYRRHAGSAVFGLLVAAGLVFGIAQVPQSGPPAAPGPASPRVPEPANPPAVQPTTLSSAEPWLNASPGQPVKAPPPYSAASAGRTGPP
jgi:hypothetical protein